MLIPPRVIEVRREICARCDQQCADYKAGQLDHADPGVACPRIWPQRWGCYGSTKSAEVPTIQPARPAPESPSLITKLTRARHELGRWLNAGAPLAPRATRRQRLAICRSCDYYRPGGNWGLGECQAPGCGCTRTKLALATSTCPLTPPKWSPCTPPATPLQPTP